MINPPVLPERLAATIDDAIAAVGEFGATVKELAERAMWAAVKFMLVPGGIVGPVYLSLAYAYKREVPTYFNFDPNGYTIITFSILIVSFFASVKKDWRRTAATWVRLSSAGFVTWFGIEMSVSITHDTEVPFVTLLCAIMLGGAYQLFFSDLAREQDDLELESLVSGVVQPTIDESTLFTCEELHALNKKVSSLAHEIHELRAELKLANETEKAPVSISE